MRVYVNNQDYIDATIQALKKEFGDLDVSRGDNWITWSRGGKELVGHVDSKYPGPDYGSYSWVHQEYAITRRVSRRCHRFLNETEMHYLTKRLRAYRSGNPLSLQEDIRFIPEVEAVYQQYVDSKYNSVGKSSIYWTIDVLITPS